jgi:DNA replication and repair protein RecF
LRLLRIALSNVRNYGHLELEPSPGLNMFVGPNAQGKSNLLEAIALLTTGKSFRTNREIDVVREGESIATLAARAEAAAGEVQLSCTITVQSRTTRKMYGVNGHHVRYASYLGRVRMVCFTPENLSIINGPPQVRRALMNTALSQESPAYYSALASYLRALQQKTALLRESIIDSTLIGIYDERLITSGTQLIIARRHFIASLAQRAASVYHKLAERDGEELAIAYAPNIPSSDMPESDIAGAFAERLRAAESSERARRSCLVGPHRDELSVKLDGRAITSYGSQGQRRSAVLSLKVAEYGVLRERSGEAPLLLLDDVLSELDATRRERFLDQLGNVEQAFVTATAAPRTLIPSQSWVVDAGTLHPTVAS